MEFRISPYKSVGPIELHMSLSEVESALQQKAMIIRQWDGTKLGRAAFPDLGIRLELQADEKCISIELFKPARPVLYDRSLLREPGNQLLEWLKSEDSEFRTDDVGLNFLTLGVGIYVPDFREEPEKFPESVLVFERGYWD